MTRYQYYLAPMEGITNATFRRTYHAHFKSMDKYFTPFLCPHTKRDLTTKEKKEKEKKIKHSKRVFSKYWMLFFMKNGVK